MSENIEVGLIVGPVTVVYNGDKSGITAVLKGQKTVTHETADGYEVEDIVEVTMTFKFRSKLTAKKLGIARHEDAKVITMRDRDMELQSFEPLSPEMQQKIA